METEEIRLDQATYIISRFFSDKSSIESLLRKRIEEAIVDKEVSFSGFVIQACEFALDNLETEKEN